MVQIAVVVAEDLSSVHTTHFRWLEIDCNATSREYDTFFWPLEVPYEGIFVYSQRGTHIYINKNKRNKK